ncbi:alpha/beta hydrolase [Christiangramia salexigens]|uniref:Alpha-mannosidase n=1 Tax=Christiangramia salexigens TaxID=1913577 RepID=A0A1L3J491_9FLAO|nr:alpha/beta hydrolase-fold protein [Christiangramia salexigens]APG59922.1 alpha-mannosidase [Christiangramia salexigens]
MKSILLTFCSLFLFTFFTYSQSTASARVSTFQIEAPQLDTIKKIWIYLPKSYESSDLQYPVVYMHDAQNLFDKETSYVGEWQVDETLDSLSSPEAIIVGIEHGGDKRIDELTPFANEKYGGGKADRYLEFIRYTLKPHIDATYRSLKSPENTSIFGSSLGGLVSFYGALKYPDTFGQAGVYSPSFWFSDKIYTYVRERSIPSEMKFYFLVGTEESEDMVPNTEEMINLLKNAGVKNENIKARYIEGGKHNEALWSKYFPESFIWLIK